MKNKNTIIAVILIIVAIFLIGVGIILALGDMGGPAIDEKASERLFIIESNNAYGVVDANGNVIASPQFSKITRINNIIYLKSESASYLYNLKNKETITLDGFETDIKYIKTANGFLDRYVLQYGATESDAIYRVIDETGNKVSNKDFASLSAVYSFLELPEPNNFIPKAVENTVLDKATVVATLTYPSVDNKSQYIVKKVESGITKYGIVDENNKQVLEPIFDKISQAETSNKACLATKGDIHYVILANGTSIETEAGFEFDYNEDGYVIQKRGTTGNKIYNLNGDVIIDKIFSYPAEIVTLNSPNAKYLLMQDSKTNLWSMYNMDSTEKIDAEFSNLVVDYLHDKDINIINTSFMYKNMTSLIGVDLTTFETFNINIPYTVIAPLESGLSIDIADKVEEQQ